MLQGCVCVVFVLAILSNNGCYLICPDCVCVVFVLAILSNSVASAAASLFVCVVFVLAILSNLKPQIPFKRPGRKHR